MREAPASQKEKERQLESFGVIQEDRFGKKMLLRNIRDWFDRILTCE